MRKVCVLILMFALLLSGCGAETTDAAPSLSAATAETVAETAPSFSGIDLTSMNSTMMMAQVVAMQNEPDAFLGKAVKMQGIFLVGEGETRNYYYCLVADATACCQQGFEFLWDGHRYPDDYPEPGSQIIVEGIFDTYWEDGYQYMQLINANLQPV